MHKYELGEQLGKGATSIVYSGILKQTGEKVAIKQIPIRVHPKIRANETQILRQIQHHNIIKFYETFVENGFQYVVLENCQMGQLGDFMKKYREPLPQIIVKGIIYFIFKAINYLNEMKICHRDLKPANILFNMHNILKVADFGLSRIIQNQDDLMKTEVGTPLYMTPEQIDKNSYDRRVDTWSVGIIAYELMFTKHPFYITGNNKEELYTKVSAIEIDWNTVEQSPFKTFLMKCICLEPDRLTAFDALNNQYFADVKQNEEKYQKLIQQFLSIAVKKQTHTINENIGKTIFSRVLKYLQQIYPAWIDTVVDEPLPLKKLLRHTIGYHLQNIKTVKVSMKNLNEIDIPFHLFQKLSTVFKNNNITQLQNQIGCCQATQTLLQEFTKDPSIVIGTAKLLDVISLALNSPLKIEIKVAIPSNMDLSDVDLDKIQQYLLQRNPSNADLHIIEFESELFVEKKVEWIGMKRLSTLHKLFKPN